MPGRLKRVPSAGSATIWPATTNPRRPYKGRPCRGRSRGRRGERQRSGGGTGARVRDEERGTHEARSLEVAGDACRICALHAPLAELLTD